MFNISICIPIPSDLDRLSNHGRARTEVSYAYRFLQRFSLACTSCANVGIEGGKAGALMAMSWVHIRSSLFPPSRPPRQGHTNPSSSFRIIENVLDCSISILFSSRLTMVLVKGLVAACYTLLLSSGAATYAAPLGHNDVEHSQLGSTTALSPRAEDFYLRLMPLGASITRGDPADPEDPDQNGYRKFLRDRLRFDGWEVNMVGSVSSWGNMNDRVSC